MYVAHKEIEHGELNKYVSYLVVHSRSFINPWVSGSWKGNGNPWTQNIAVVDSMIP